MDEDVSTGIEVDDLPCLPAGTVVGGYVLRECVGRGAMAHIYRAEHCVLGKEVALKILAPSLMADTAARNRLLREARVTATLKHPNIIDVSDARFHEGNPYLIMDLLSGEDLQSRLSREGRLSHEETVELGLALASALAAAHARGIVHRDIKPGNVFLSRGPDGEIVPKLLDFGISRAPSALSGGDLTATPRHELMGSPLYLSPEGVRGATHHDARSDQYALGVMLYECVTGRPPYLEDSLYSLFQAIVGGNLPPPGKFAPDIPAALESVLMRALSHDPERRFEHVRDLGVALLDSASPRARLIWSLTFGLYDLPERQGSDTAPALALDTRTQTQRLGRPRFRTRQSRLALVTASIVAVPALYALSRALDAERLQPEAAVTAMHSSFEATVLPVATPVLAVAPPEPVSATSVAALTETAPANAAAIPEPSLADVAASTESAGAGVRAAAADTALRGAKRSASATARAGLARLDAGRLDAGRLDAGRLDAARLQTSNTALAASTVSVGATPQGAMALRTPPSAEQDEVRKLFFSPRRRPVASANANTKRVPSAADKPLR